MDICLHLAKQLPDGSLDFRPTAGQRSTLGLLRYISFCAIGGASAMADGNWERYKAFEKRASTMAAEEFPDAMARQRGRSTRSSPASPRNSWRRSARRPRWATR